MREKWMDIWNRIAEKLHFLRLDEDPDREEEIRVEERPLSSGAESAKDLPEGDLKEKLAQNRRWVFRRRVLLTAIAVCIVVGFTVYNSVHTFQDYVITDSVPNEAVSGTQYIATGKNLYRYNTDGISFVSRNNEVKWSITYNMQAPIADVCGNTMAVAEQQGRQVYVVNEKGLVGSFQTVQPILKVRVSRQGVVAVVLEEDEVTWVNLYQPDGTSIASDKTTISGSGYPLDIDISPDGQRLAVSFLKVEEGIITSDIVFYHFGSAGQSQEDHIVGRESFAEAVAPEIFFISNSRAVAVSDHGYAVFRGGDQPKRSALVEFDEEIVSCFHDGSRIGFLFDSEKDGYNYRMELYNYSGRRNISTEINADFDRIKVENGQILMFDDGHCDIFTTAGRKRFSSDYEKEISDIFYFSEFRRYLVITQDSFDRIRIS